MDVFDYEADLINVHAETRNSWGTVRPTNDACKRRSEIGVLGELVETV
jgi:hypothetical protein